MISWPRGTRNQRSEKLREQAIRAAKEKQKTKEAQKVSAPKLKGTMKAAKSAPAAKPHINY